jgi:haloalkane dehalogenase
MAQVSDSGTASQLEVRRTPDDRFVGLPDYSFAPHYFALESGLRMHFLDEGPRHGPVVLLLHGEPTWSYLYRHFIPLLVAGGCRVLAPDLIGFGRSDKPVDVATYTYEAHVSWLQEWVTYIDTADVTLFCQDWGGLLGLRLVAADPERFAGVIAANTLLPIGRHATDGFDNWLAYIQSAHDLPIGRIVRYSTNRKLTDAEVAAYDAPFPDFSYKAGARAFPRLVPITPDHGSVAENIAAWKVLETFDRPFVTAFSDNDPVTAGEEIDMKTKIPGARGQSHFTITDAGHFLQEDAPGQLAGIILDVMRKIALTQ